MRPPVLGFRYLVQLLCGLLDCAREDRASAQGLLRDSWNRLLARDREGSQSQDVRSIYGVASKILSLERCSFVSSIFDFGKSVMSPLFAVRIRHKVRQLLPEDAPGLPVSIVEDAGNLKKLRIAYRGVMGTTKRRKVSMRKVSTIVYMRQLVDDYSRFSGPSWCIHNIREPSGETVILTGATGARGYMCCIS